MNFCTILAVYSAFPHGVISYGIFGNFGVPDDSFYDMFPKLKPHVLTLQSNFWLPLRREFFLLMGAHDLCFIFYFAITLRVLLNFVQAAATFRGNQSIIFYRNRTLGTCV